MNLNLKKLTRLQKHFNTYYPVFFSDPLGKKIQKYLALKEPRHIQTIESLLYQDFTQKNRFKIKNIWHYYLFNRFLNAQIPEHALFYQNFEFPEKLKAHYICSFLTPISEIFSFGKSETVSTNSAPLFPYADKKQEMYNSFTMLSPELLYFKVKEYFQECGSGFFSNYYYFEWDRQLKGISSYSQKYLSDLTGYESQKQSLYENTLNFINGHSANHAFLYGSRGTGKTTLIRALLEEFKEKKLRLIKIFRENIEHLPKLYEVLKKRKERFIINLDDISYDEGELIYKKHKVAIDSFFDRQPKNVLLYATSNSQEIVKYFRQETTDTIILDNRSEEEKKLETPQRQVYDERRAFTERFGLSIFFGRADEKAALDILELYRKKYSLKVPLEALYHEYRQWVSYHGAVNGRTIENFMKYFTIKKPE